MVSTFLLGTTSLSRRSLGKPVTPEIVAGWNETTLPTLLSNYGLENIYNADEFRLFYHCLPDKSYQLKQRNVQVVNTAKSGSLVWQLPMPLAINCLCLLLVKQKIQGVLKTLRNFPVEIDRKERPGWIVFYLKNG